MTVYITGDTHGQMKSLRRWALKNELDENDTVIILGDNGLNFHRGWKDRNKKKDLTKGLLCNFFIIRGNHDDRPEDDLVIRGERGVDSSRIIAGEYIPWAHRENFFDNEVIVEKRFPTIKYAIDGNIYEIDGNKCLVIGGGYSVDKFKRLIEGWKWVENEKLTPEEMAKIFETYTHNHVDIILSHVAPRAFETYMRHLWLNPAGGIAGGWDNVDHEMEDWMNSFLWHPNAENLKLWYYGHYHANLNAGPIGVMLYEAIIPFGEKAPPVWTDNNHRAAT